MSFVVKGDPSLYFQHQTSEDKSFFPQITLFSPFLQRNYVLIAILECSLVRTID